MYVKLPIGVLLLLITGCFSQDIIHRPSFPDVFQTEIEGTFFEEKGVVEIDASMFYDRTNNRAALFITKEGDLTKLIFDFDSDESITIDDNECDVQEIPEEQAFFPFIVIEGKKKLSRAEEAFFFTKSELDHQTLVDYKLPTLVYKAKLNIPQYGKNNCELTHLFSKPDIELPICKEGLYCNSTLISLSVSCKDEEGGPDLDHVYIFSRFKYEIEDDSIFLPPPGVHCDIKNKRTFPKFPSYFSFTFDIIEKPDNTPNDSAVFTTHKEVWYDAVYNIIRIDEFDKNGLLFSSRIFDFKAKTAFTIVTSVPTCGIGPVTRDFPPDELTRLPKAFFSQNDSTTDNAVYVGMRKVHGLDYHVWSLSWTDEESDAKIVEEIYFLQIISNKEFSSEVTEREMYLQISHVDTYTYERDSDTSEYQLTLLKYFSINNYRSRPKEWVAFDVLTCFSNKEKKEFIMKVKGPPLVKGSQSYREVLESLYDKILAATGVSVVRISELTGVFDGVELIKISGSILDNSESSGWPKDSQEPGMEETFKLMKKAVSENKLAITFKAENNVESNITVTSIEDIQDIAPPENTCFSGSSLAAASLALLLMGMIFGVVGYYVFLKKRRPANVHVRMSEIKDKDKD